MPWPTCSSFIALVKSLNDIILIAKWKTTLFPADGIKLRNPLDGLGQNFYDAWGVVFVGLIDAVQVQSEPKVPSSMQLHSWFLKLWPGGCNHTEFFHVFFTPKWFPFFLTTKWSTLFDTQMVNLKGIKRNQNCSLKANTLVKYRSWCCFQTSASRDSKLRLLHPVYPYDHDLPFSGVGKVTKLPQQASVSILWLQMSTVCFYTTQFLW